MEVIEVEVALGQSRSCFDGFLGREKKRRVEAKLEGLEAGQSHKSSLATHIKSVGPVATVITPFLCSRGRVGEGYCLTAPTALTDSPSMTGKLRRDTPTSSLHWPVTLWSP